jgi:hypothetical protein
VLTSDPTRRPVGVRPHQTPVQKVTPLQLSRTPLMTASTLRQIRCVTNGEHKHSQVTPYTQRPRLCLTAGRTKQSCEVCGSLAVNATSAAPTQHGTR